MIGKKELWRANISKSLWEMGQSSKKRMRKEWFVYSRPTKAPLKTRHHSETHVLIINKNKSAKQNKRLSFIMIRLSFFLSVRNGNHLIFPSVVSTNPSVFFLSFCLQIRRKFLPFSLQIRRKDQLVFRRKEYPWLVGLRFLYSHIKNFRFWTFWNSIFVLLRLSGVNTFTFGSTGSFWICIVSVHFWI